VKFKNHDFRKYYSPTKFWITIGILFWSGIWSGLTPVRRGKTNLKKVKNGGIRHIYQAFTRKATEKSKTVGITYGLSDRGGDHERLADKFFNLVISSGEILINLTPDR
jgi:hypothetical protein